MKNPISTITGLTTLVLSGLVLFNVITPEQELVLGEIVASLATSVVSLIAILGGDPGTKESGL